MTGDRRNIINLTPTTIFLAKNTTSSIGYFSVHHNIKPTFLQPLVNKKNRPTQNNIFYNDILYLYIKTNRIKALSD